jgi:hypothetical protein
MNSTTRDLNRSIEDADQHATTKSFVHIWELDPAGPSRSSTPQTANTKYHFCMHD